MLGSLFEFSNNINSLSDELFFGHVSRVNGDHFSLVGFLFNLDFLDGCFMNGDSLTELHFVNSDALVRSV